ncbi:MULTISPECIES: phage portal protein [unclassified Methylophaga]|jgi:PBSX family phage portal protein|uniref:phage portal protein n=2 Tax=Methylophaga TaxID=40222 RepID=UPI00259C75B2|nr:MULTISPECIES: phage portal protein [unclassified Methylophaga]|tara:strand:- start:10356 stop:11339 length:984 start_codon:yes stop_codon:yes gene_type:complete
MSDTKIQFTFGDPEPVLNNKMTDYLGVFTDLGGKYWVPPVSLNGLAQTRGANSHHNSILHFKKNMILKWFEPSKMLSYSTLKQIALDFEVFGMFYVQIFTNGFGRPVRLGHLPSIAMRRGKKPGVFFKLLSDGSEIEFAPDEVIQINEYDVMQSIYGIPEYMGGIQSVLLSEDAGLFRRKYYKNGAHMGYIFLTSDTGLEEDDLQILSDQVSQSKGPGNFRSMHLNIERTNAKEPVKIIPVGDIGTKDEFERIKNITRGEILSMHRMYPGLSGVIPESNSGFGDMEKIMRVYHELEVGAMQQPFLELNELLGKQVVNFREPDWKFEL